MCSFSPPSACELASIQDTIADSLNTPCTYEIKGQATKDSQGRTVFTSPSTGSTVCLVLPLTGPNERVSTNKLISTSDHKILLPLDTPLTERDTVIVGSTRYEIQATDKGRSNAVYLTCFTTKSNP